MKVKEMRALPREEWEKKLSELRKELMKENAQIKTGTTPANPGKIKRIKKSIAQILTELREKTKSSSKKEEG